MTLNQKALEAAVAAYHNETRPNSAISSAIRAYLSTLAPADDGLIERLQERAKEDDECADNSRVVADLLSPELAKFNERDDSGWNTYTVRMAVDHRNSMERDRRYASTLRQAADTITALTAEIERLRVERDEAKRTSDHWALEVTRLRQMHLPGERSDPPSNEAIASAVRATEYKYFGDYALSGDQWEAVFTLISAARHYAAAESRAAALETLLDKAVWQPIETAPRDGTVIDLWGEFETGARRASDAFWNVDASEWQLGTFHAGQFVHRPNITHWMPLPSDPKQEGRL